MCRYCSTGSSRSSTDRLRVLDLLALIERQDVLPTASTLRIAGELLAWTEQTESRFRCDAAMRSEP